MHGFVNSNYLIANSAHVGRAGLQVQVEQEKIEDVPEATRSNSAGWRRLKAETSQHLDPHQELLIKIYGKEIRYPDEKTGTFFYFNEKTSTLGFCSPKGGCLRPSVHILIELMTSLKPVNLSLGSYFDQEPSLGLRPVQWEIEQWEDQRKERRDHFHLLMEALPHSSVSSLNLRYCNSFGALSDREISSLAQMLSQSNIQELDIRGLIVNSESFQVLAKALPGSKIVKLDAALNPLDDAGLSALGEALPLSQLEDLNLSPLYHLNRARVSAEGLRAFSVGVRNSNLKKLDLGHLFLGRGEVDAVSEMIQHSKLEEICLDIGRESVESFATYLEGSAIKRLTFAPHSLGNQGLIRIVKAAAHSDLEEITLSGSGIWVDSAEEMDELIDALSQTHLKKLNLGEVQGFSSEIRDDMQSRLKKFNIEIEMHELEKDFY